MNAGDITDITQLLLRERQSRVRAVPDQLRDCYHPDATVTTSWMSSSVDEFIADSAAGSGRNRPRIVNRLGGPVIRLAETRGTAELPSTTTHWITVNGTEAVLSSFMRLLYRVERRQGIWRISSLVAVNESDTLAPAVPGTDLRIDPRELEGLRHSYRFLAYTRLLSGGMISQDLYGTDRMPAVEALYADDARWLQEAGD
ncbi:nuclear transport factor 2 family protein [Streptomyces longwoodensis]|uniref:nuclear transport factor 2 family protein n=1 Tax=Streptomyces longwoodensis TaxID=68231 RepID=UPI0033C1D2C3